MAEKMIPCKTCGKLFKPCSFCQENSDVFRWRNFACSKECAIIYINKATEYRKKQKLQENDTLVEKENIDIIVPTEQKLDIVEEKEEIKVDNFFKTKKKKKNTSFSNELDLTD